MEGAPQLPENKTPEVKKASLLVRAAALVGIAAAAAAPANRAAASLTPDTKRIEMTRMARPEDIDETALKNKINTSISNTTASQENPKGKAI